jgi:acetyl/propionyl-CoA carboxylase alpha subunit
VIVEVAVDGTPRRVEVTGGGGSYSVRIDGRATAVDWRDAGGPFASLLMDGRSHDVGIEPRAGGYRVLVGGDEFVVELLGPARADPAAGGRAPTGPARLLAPMPGRIVRVLVEAGQTVEAGQGLVVIEAMKMENELRAPRAGRVAELPAVEGRTVETGALLAVVE